MLTIVSLEATDEFAERSRGESFIRKAQDTECILGVFIPFILMFGETFRDVPIVQVSIDSSLDPEKEWALGAALDSLR